MSALNLQVLVLNNAWTPINVRSAFDALCDVFMGKADIVGEDYKLHDFESWVNNWSDASLLKNIDEQKIIKGVNVKIPAPEIIKLKTYKGFIVKKPRLSRAAVYVRDDYTCQLCGKKLPQKMLNIDHVLPKSKGGKTEWTNVVASCIKCNSLKGDKTLIEAKMKLLRKPFQPHWSVASKHFSAKNIPKSWEEFIGKVYWQSELQK